MVGIEKKVLEKAKEKAEEFEERLNFQRINRVNEQFSQLIRFLERGSLE